MLQFPYQCYNISWIFKVSCTLNMENLCLHKKLSHIRKRRTCQKIRIMYPGYEITIDAWEWIIDKLTKFVFVRSTANKLTKKHAETQLEVTFFLKEIREMVSKENHCCSRKTFPRVFNCWWWNTGKFSAKHLKQKNENPD